jgi:hypothetical protein
MWIASILVGWMTLSPGSARGQHCLACEGAPGPGSYCIGTELFGNTDCINDANGCHYRGENCDVVAACFLGGTPVLTARGPVPIESLVVGDLVLQFVDGREVTSPVTAVHRAVAESYLKINNNIGVTREHPFLVGGNWVPAGQLDAGDSLAAPGGWNKAIVAIEEIAVYSRVYNISTGGNHTFVAGGAIVHNKPPTPGQ